MKISAEVEGVLNAAEDNDTKIYHPAHNSQTGGALPTIFLAQMAYWWHQMRRKPFYKFVEPCNHKLYEPGQSWTEELGIGKTALIGYFQKFGRKLKAYEQGNWREILTHDENLFFVYWTNRSDNLTHWAFSEVAYLKMRLKAYKLSSDADLGGPDTNLGGPDADLGGPDAEELSPQPDLPTIIDYTENTQRLPKEERETQLDINDNGSLSLMGGEEDSIFQMNREQLLAEIENLPELDTYQTLCMACGWDLRLISKAKRCKVHLAAHRLWEIGYSLDNSAYSFLDYWKEVDWGGKKNDEPPNNPQTVLDCWDAYRDYLIKLVSTEKWARAEAAKTGESFVEVVRSLDLPQKAIYAIVYQGHFLERPLSRSNGDDYNDFETEILQEELAERRKWDAFFSGKTDRYFSD